jgi:hypothetical protein
MLYNDGLKFINYKTNEFKQQSLVIDFPSISRIYKICGNNFEEVLNFKGTLNDSDVYTILLESEAFSCCNCI